MTVGALDAAACERLRRQGGRPAQIVTGLKRLVEQYGDAIRERFPPIPRRVSGLNLPRLLPENGFDLAKALVGSEGTCVVVLEARVRLVPNPASRVLLVLGYPSVYEAGDHVPEVMESGPIALEGIDDRLVEDMKRAHLHVEYTGLLPEGAGWLLVEFGGASPREARGKAHRLMQRLQRAGEPPSMELVEDPAQAQHIWKVRESGLGATAHVPEAPITWEGWEDSSVPPERLGEYLRKLRALFDRYGYGCDLYGHFGQGCVHTRIDFDLETAAGIEKYRRFIHDAAVLVTGLGGSISGEHGDGQSKAELLPIMFGDELVQAFAEFKAIWDPGNMMNPGKVVHAYRADENLRLGAGYRPAPVESRMFFASDKDDFGRTVLRCVGVGECRKKDGTMCPSYMATGEEMHSTRGRAHLLFEMLNGERESGVLKRGWKEPAVKEALDLCLSCKGCKKECPVKVDMASYKAEFLSHYFEHHRRPLVAHAFGFVDRWSRWAARAPRLANFLTQTAALQAMGKRLAGIAPQRQLPAFARRTFREEFVPRAGGGGRDVLLWPDTFNNHFHPGVAHAAVDVLRHGGWQVRLPPPGLCCGRPLYEFGFLDDARSYLRHVVEALGEDLHAGTPIVVLEPACLSVLKEELPMMLPRDEQARRLNKQSLLLADFLDQHAGEFQFEPLRQSALVHAHCHHKTVLGFEAERRILQEMLELDVSMPDTGCCGMAGAFGFEAHKFDVSMACGERVLLPRVRQSGPDTLIVADGYSCREQIVQSTGREVLHFAELLQRALPETSEQRKAE
jgi:Fe-S oxidoreductase